MMVLFLQKSSITLRSRSALNFAAMRLHLRNGAATKLGPRETDAASTFYCRLVVAWLSRTLKIFEKIFLKNFVTLCIVDEL